LALFREVATILCTQGSVASCTQCKQKHSYTAIKKTTGLPFYSVKNQPLLIIFGTQDSREISYNKVAFSALTLLVGRQEGYLACIKMGGWWKWAVVSPDGVAPSRMVGVSVSVNLPLHQKVQKFSSGTSSPGWSQKKGRKMVVWWWFYSYHNIAHLSISLARCSHWNFTN